jgi:hypothetical protein
MVKVFAVGTDDITPLRSGERDGEGYRRRLSGKLSTLLFKGGFRLDSFEGNG